MQLVYHVATTVDGFIAEPDGSFARFPPAQDSATEYLAALADYSHVLMGRKTYDVGRVQGVLDPYPALETHVVSRTLDEGLHPHVNVVREDPVGFTRALKAREGKAIYLCGGGELAGALVSSGLVDVLIVKQHPVLFGRGVPLLSGLAAPRTLHLTSSRVHASGVVVLRYELG